MSKRQAYRSRLESLLVDGGKLEGFLLEKSALPGRRANSELAAALADVFQEKGATAAQWKMLVEWASLSPEEAPTNSRREFLPFSAVQALGALYPGSDEKKRGDILTILRAAARGERWRTREAAAMAFQRVGERDFEALVAIVSDWLERASRLERRAIVAALAHPPLLSKPGAVEFALDVTDTVLKDIRKLVKTGRETDEFKSLAKGLGYAISVFVVASPELGFALLRRWAGADDVAIKKIVAANIRKSRLAKNFPDECREVGELLSWENP